MLAALSLVAGVLTAIAVLPVVGVAGIAARDAAKTFDNLPVAGLGQVPSRSEIYDSSGHLLAYYEPGYPTPIYRVPVTFNQIAPVMRRAIVAIEDARFWLHGALDIRGTVRAIVLDLSGQAVQGGSDLAQQYVKNACILTAKTMWQKNQCYSHTLTRKITELRIAANVEHEMTKQQLLTAYLNVAYFENQAYGIQVASQLYFSTTARNLTLPEAAMLAGLVENPSQYDPVANPSAAWQRRNVVLEQMAKVGYISQATANQAVKTRLGLHLSSVPLQTGCTSPTPQVKMAAFFCDYVLSVMAKDKQYRKAYSQLTTVGGLKIYTTLNVQDQRAADEAVNYVLPDHNDYANPNRDVDTEAMVQPGTGYIRAIAVNRTYGFGPGQDSIDYAVNTPYNGGVGVQTGSSSKLFTLVTALKDGLPFGFSLRVHDGEFAGPLYSCSRQYVPPWQVHNSDGDENGDIPLYYGTVASINAFYASLEAKVGLCNVVKTAISMGMTRANGNSLLSWIGKPGPNNPNIPADLDGSFTLGSINVSPLNMAGAYATVASGGIYCHPIAISSITDARGNNLPVESARCHRVMPQGVASAANYVLEGVLQTGTAAGRGINRPAAGKTGTANSGYYAAFAGYTPTLVGYVSVFNPTDPTTIQYNGQPGAMLGCPEATYRAFPGDYVTCPGQMFGDDAPGSTWEFSFLRADLGKALNFGAVPGYFFSLGGGTAPPPPPAPTKSPGGGKGGGPGGGNGGGPGGNGGGPGGGGH
jgi:membrane peptidoglycan carboxypeptidase